MYEELEITIGEYLETYTGNAKESTLFLLLLSELREMRAQFASFTGFLELSNIPSSRVDTFSRLVGC